MVFSVSTGAYSPSIAERNGEREKPGRLAARRSYHRGLSADNSAYLEFRSTYDNPSFQYDDFSHGPPTTRSYKYADDETPASITFKEGGEKKACCCFAIFIVLIILIYAGVVVGVCVYFLVLLPEHRASMKPVEHYASLFSCQVRVVEGPFSKYDVMLADPRTSPHQTFAAAWQFQMDQTFKESSMKSKYNQTRVTGFSKGSVVIDFDIHLTEEIGAQEAVYEDIKSIIKSSCKATKEKAEDSLCISGIFIFSKDDINVTSTSGESSVTTAKPTTMPQPNSECVLIPNNTAFGCHKFYTHAQFPNYLNQMTMKEATDSIASNGVLVDVGCYAHTKLFVCSLLLPKCVNMTVNITTTAPPPTAVPTQADTTAGATAAVDTTQSATTEQPGATSTDSSGTQKSANDETSTPTDAPYPLTEEQPVRLPTCRNLCEAALKNCRFLYSWGGSTKYLALNCSDYPDSIDPDECVGGKEANEPVAAAPCSSGYMQCDPSKKCIKNTWKCDGFEDCEDKTDEKDCSVCPAAKYQCFGGACVDKTARCDGTGECSMDSDERQCVKFVNSGSTTLNGQGNLEVYSSTNEAFVSVCHDGWDQNATTLTCTQMGYNSTINVSYSEVSENGTIGAKLKTSDLSGKYIQGNIDLGSISCPSNKTVKLSCGKAVCGIRPAYVPSYARVVGGSEVRPGSWPWTVALYGGEDGAFFCGGTLISEQWVLTAGHCIGGMTPGPADDLKVYLGITRRFAHSKYKQVRSAMIMTKNPNFTMPHPVDDLGLIKLDRPVEINEYVRPVCLPAQGKAMKPGMSGYATGWGKESEGADNYSDVMKQVMVTLTDTVSCSAKLINKEPYFKGMVKLGKSICGVGKKGFDTCQGDSGGPLLFEESGKWFIGGIVSTGIGCARALPAIYTNVPNYVDWIHSVINS